MTTGDRVIAYAPQPVAELIGVGVVGPAFFKTDTTLESPHRNFRPITWYDSNLPIKLADLPDTLRNGQNRVIPAASLEHYSGDPSLLETEPLNVDLDSVQSPPTGTPELSPRIAVNLEPGREYSADRIQSEFGKGRTKGIEILYDANDEKYLRLFSSPSSDYGDDLDAIPMRYVGEKNFADATIVQGIRLGLERIVP
jgi:hypothetical protein